MQEEIAAKSEKLDTMLKALNESLSDGAANKSAAELLKIKNDIGQIYNEMGRFIALKSWKEA